MNQSFDEREREIAEKEEDIKAIDLKLDNEISKFLNEKKEFEKFVDVKAEEKYQQQKYLLDQREENINEEVENRLFKRLEDEKGAVDKECEEKRLEAQNLLDSAKKEKQNYEDYKKGLNVYLAGLSAYSILITSLSAILSKNFFSDFKIFWSFIWDKVVCGFFSIASSISSFFTDLMDKIPQPIIAFILHWLIFFAFWIGVVFLVLFVIGFIFKIFIDLQDDEEENVLSIAIFVISFAIVVFLGDLIKSVVPINLFLLLLIINGIGLAIRYHKVCLRVM